MPSSTNDRDSSSMQRQSGNKGLVLACGPLSAKLMCVTMTMASVLWEARRPALLTVEDLSDHYMRTSSNTG